MEYYILKVNNIRKETDEKSSEYISQNLTDHVDDAVISAPEVSIFLMICMGLLESKNVFEVSYRRIDNSYKVEITYVDYSISEILVIPYADKLGTSMFNDIFSALIAAGLLFFLPVEGVTNE